MPNHTITSDVIHGHKFSKVYAPTDAQVKATLHLAYAYMKAFPNIKPEFPRDNDGKLITTIVPMEKRNGLLHHYHVKRSKIDAMGFPTDKFEADLKDMLEQDKLPIENKFWDRLRRFIST